MLMMRSCCTDAPRTDVLSKASMRSICVPTQSPTLVELVGALQRLPAWDSALRTRHLVAVGDAASLGVGVKRGA